MILLDLKVNERSSAVQFLINNVIVQVFYLNSVFPYNFFNEGAKSLVSCHYSD